MGNRIALLGLPGSGKGTHGPRLADYLSEVTGETVPYWSMGDLLYARSDTAFDPDRHATEQALDEVENIDEAYDTFGDYLEAGHYGDPDFVRDVLEEELGGRDAFVLDGYPRNREQAEDMETRLGGLDLIIYLEADEDELARRIADRLIDPETRTPYRRGHNMPDDPAIRERLVPKEGDSAEATAKRIRDQRRKQGDVLDFYQERDVLIETVDANPGVEAVWENVRAAVDSFHG